MTAPKVEVPSTGLLGRDAIQAEIGQLLKFEEEGPPKEPEPEKVPVNAPQAEPEQAQVQEEQDAESEEKRPDPETEGEESKESEQGGADESEESRKEPTERIYTVKVDGKEEQVTESELIRGYSREAHFTRKMQTVSQKDKALEAERLAIQAERQQLAERLNLLERMVAPATEAVDWARLRQELPADEFAARWAEYQIQQEQLAQVRRDREAVEQRYAAQEAERLARYVEQQKQLLREAIPELQDEKMAPELLRANREYGLSLGYTEDELDTTLDHRAVVILDKARRWDELQKKQQSMTAKIQEKIVKGTKTAKPGAVQDSPPRVVTELTRHKQRLAKTGRREDAQRAIRMLLDAEDEIGH
jgi:hypothetical protein